MKTKIISKLKKELLLVELPKNGYYENYIDGTEIRDFLTDEVLVISKSDYTLLGSPDDLKEEDARELVERTGLGNPSYSGEWYECYKNPDAMYSKAKDSFHSALESEIFWDVNPLGNEPIFAEFSPGVKVMNEPKEWERIQAQEKTFDKKRTLIFAKNEKL